MILARFMCKEELDLFKSGKVVRPIKTRDQWNMAFTGGPGTPMMCFMDWSNAGAAFASYPVWRIFGNEPQLYLVLFKTKCHYWYTWADYPRWRDPGYGGGGHYVKEVDIPKYSRSEMRIFRVFKVKDSTEQTAEDACAKLGYQRTKKSYAMSYGYFCDDDDDDWWF